MAEQIDEIAEHDWWDPGGGLWVWQSDGSTVLSCRHCGLIKGPVSSTRPCRPAGSVGVSVIEQAPHIGGGADR